MEIPTEAIIEVIRKKNTLILESIQDLTSQFFANIYLNGFDHFIKEQLKVGNYVRYVDDFALFGDDPELLVDTRLAIEEYLVKLKLENSPN